MFLNILIALIIFSMGLVGAGYALWNESLHFSMSAIMGNLDVSFESCDASGDPNGSVEAEISSAGKAIVIDIKDAYPSYSAVIDYGVINNGTVPACYQLVPASLETSGLEVSITQSEDSIPPNGGRSGGVININVTEEAQAKQVYDFSFELIFQQSSVEK